MTRIASTLEDLQQEIAKSCQKRSIFEHNVRLIAVSKRQPLEKIKELAKLGQIDFAENQLQEALEKIAQLTDFPIKWHMIGAIQSRKCKHIAENFDWVQSVDRAKLVKKLSENRPPHKKPLNICIQVNLFHEPQKAGVTAEQLWLLAEQITDAPNLRLRGLMALPPKTNELAKQRQNFDKISKLYQQLSEKYPKIDTLSIGMTGDFAVAISAGSSMIRVGTRLFGERPTNKVSHPTGVSE